MKGRIGDKQRMLHILDAINEIENYISGLGIADFHSNSMARFASIKQLEIIGEPARYVSEPTKAVYPDIEWEEIIGLRNILVHEYFGIDSNLIWQIIVTDLPIFKASVQKILSTLN